MMRIGIINYFNKEKGFGFITSLNFECFVHIDKINSIIIDKNVIVAYEYIESKKYKGKYEAINVELVTEVSAVSLFERVSQEEKLILIKNFPIAFNRYLDLKVSYENYIEFHNKAKAYVNAFDKFEFATKINAKISTWRHKKPGDDDSFAAFIESVYPKDDDPYLKKLNPHYKEDTYSERGFYSCYSMQDDYNKDYRNKDEKKLPDIQKTLQTEFLSAYKAEEHIKELLEYYISDYIKEIRDSMSK